MVSSDINFWVVFCCFSNKFSLEAVFSFTALNLFNVPSSGCSADAADINRDHKEFVSRK